MLNLSTSIAAIACLMVAGTAIGDELVERRGDSYVVTVVGEWSAEHAAAVVSAKMRLRQCILRILDPAGAAGPEADRQVDCLTRVTSQTSSLQQKPRDEFTLHRQTIVAMVSDDAVDLAKQRVQSALVRRLLVQRLLVVLVPLAMVLLVLGLRYLDHLTLGDRRLLLGVVALGIISTSVLAVWCSRIWV